MRELFSNEVNELEYNISIRGEHVAPSALPIAKLYVGANIGQFPTVGHDLSVSLVSEGKYKVVVPTTLIAKKKLAKVVFSYSLENHGQMEDSRIYDVTQRLISFEEFNDNLGEDDTNESWGTDWETFNKTEQLVRHVIEAYCRQKFNLWQGSQIVFGAKGAIMLPQHLMKLDGIIGGEVEYDFDLNNGEQYTGGYYISNNGMSLVSRGNWTKPTVLYTPNPQNAHVTITGLWGYEGIPADLQEAALELMRFYMSDDMEARRKYMLNLSSDNQTSFAFNFGAFRDSTGNPVADDLLNAYRVYIFGAI